MELAQLEYFRIVARFEHITRAAEELHVSQPALSRAITRLEESVGVPLFDREPNRIRLNAHGQIFLRRIERVFEELENGIQEINDADSPEQGSAAFATSTSGFMCPPVRDYLLQHPLIHMKQFTMNPAQMKEALEMRKIDFAVSFFPIISDSIEWHPQLDEEILVFVSEDHPLADREVIDLAELSHERFIFNNASFGVRDIICDQCLLAGFTPDILYEGNEDEMVVPLVEQNLGVLFVPSISHLWRHNEAKNLPDHPLSALHISNNIITRTIGFCTMRERYFSKAAQNFYDYLEDYFGHCCGKNA